MQKPGTSKVQQAVLGCRCDRVFKSSSCSSPSLCHSPVAQHLAASGDARPWRAPSLAARAPLVARTRAAPNPPAVPACSFELHIYTMGDRDYAAEMAKLLDPGGKLFHGRIISSVRVLCPLRQRLARAGRLLGTGQQAKAGARGGRCVFAGARCMHGPREVGKQQACPLAPQTGACAPCPPLALTPLRRLCPAQGDSTQRYVKDLDVVLGRERVVLILDDTEGVWPRHRDNLVQIERYLFFPADAGRFGFR